MTDLGEAKCTTNDVNTENGSDWFTIPDTNIQDLIFYSSGES